MTHIAEVLLIQGHRDVLLSAIYISRILLIQCHRDVLLNVIYISRIKLTSIYKNIVMKESLSKISIFDKNKVEKFLCRITYAFKIILFFKDS